MGRATLVYLAVMVGIITLAPFQFAATPQHGLTNLWTWSDLVMNVLMFLPFGFVFQMTRPAGSPAPVWQVLLLGASLSVVVEMAQLFEATRYSSPLDIATNATGAAVGSAIYLLALRRVQGESAVRTLALELPLMALVYLLVPLAWLMGLSGSGSRQWLSVLVGVFAGGILGTVHAAYLTPGQNGSRRWLLATALLWFTVALLPATIRDRGLVAAAAAVTVGSAWLGSIGTARYRTRFGNRRFELPTLRLVMPLFAAYLALSSLWPLDQATAPWRGSLGLLPAGTVLTDRLIYQMLEHVAAFTLVGFMTAEFYGRYETRYRDIAPRVLGWGAAVSLLLEATRGWHPAYGASATLLLMTVAACGFGGWLYQLQRDHVKALLARRTRPASLQARPDVSESPPLRRTA